MAGAVGGGVVPPAGGGVGRRWRAAWDSCPVGVPHDTPPPYGGRSEGHWSKGVRSRGWSAAGGGRRGRAVRGLPEGEGEPGSPEKGEYAMEEVGQVETVRALLALGWGRSRVA